MKINPKAIYSAISARILAKPFILSLVAFMMGASIFIYGVTRAANPTDCDSNAIVKCGVYNINVMADWYGRNLQKTRDIFNHYGINDQWSDLQNGYVTRDGDVFVGSQKVATGAISVGRENIQGSTAINIAGTTIYQRPTSVSFGSSSIPAYVKLVNGEFKWAVLKSCGNPVVANPVVKPKPEYSIQKKVIQNNPNDSTDTAFLFGSENIKVEQNSQVRFVTIITNNNNVDGGILAYDDLPLGVDYISGTYQLKDATGNIIQTGNLANIEGRRYGALLNLKANNEIKLDILATYTATTKVVNIACVAPGGTNSQCDDASVEPKPTPAPTPAYSCTNLTIDKLTRTSFKFTAKGAVSGGANITGYIFKVNNLEVYNASADNFTYSQTAPGTYTVDAYVKTDKGTTEKVAACTKTITVDNAPELPTYTIKKYVDTRDAQDNNSAVTIEPNKPFEYKVVVKNTSSTTTIDSIKTWDLLPSGVSYVDNTLKLNNVSVTNDNDYFDQTKGITVTNLKAGEEATFTFQAIIKAETDEKKAEMCTNTNGGTFYNNIAKADPKSQGTGESASDLPEKQDPAVIKCSYTPPVKHPSVIIEKEVSNYQVTVGGQFTWFITVTNNGDVDLKNVVVNDQAPANTEFLKAAELTGTTIQMDSKNFKATISELKVGQKITFAITAKLVNYQNSDITNTACVNAPEVNPSQPSKDDDCDDAKVKPVKEKCTVPGMENKDKDDPSCKPKCTVPGKENLYADDKNCKDPDCIEVNGKIVSTKGKEGCENPTAITAPSATPNTGIQTLAASASTLGLSAAAFMATSRFQKRKK